jgi:succinate dehydrogenase iron-sulfur subunit
VKLVLNVWRQAGPGEPGALRRYEVDDADANMSFLELLDVLNEKLISRGEEPIAFDHDCREGICGSCGFMIDGIAHGPMKGTTVCQLHLRHFNDGDELTLEPWRAKAFPVIRDLIVDRSAFDRIVQAGGFVSVNTGSVPDGNALAIAKTDADVAMDAAQCIGCGACVAQCPNGAAQLFTSAKVSHLALLPQGQPERWSRVQSLVAQLEDEAFGSCTNCGECEAVCPKSISIDFIAMLNRDWIRSALRAERTTKSGGGSG